MKSWWGWWTISVFALGSHVSSSAAQVTSQYGVSAVIGTARRADNRTGSDIARNGIALGIEGHYNVGRVNMDARYLQGGLSDNHDVIEGEIFVGTHVVPWLKAQLGRHIRSVLINDVTERWSMWEIRLRAQGEVWTPASQAYGVYSYAQLVGALAGSVNVPGDFGSGRGIEGGLLVRFAESQFAARLGYRVDRGTTSGGVRKETIHAFTISFGWGR